MSDVSGAHYRGYCGPKCLNIYTYIIARFKHVVLSCTLKRVVACYLLSLKFYTPSLFDCNVSVSTLFLVLSVLNQTREFTNAVCS